MGTAVSWERNSEHLQIKKKKKKRDLTFALKDWISTNHPKTDTQSKVGLSRESISFLVKRQNLKSIAIYFTDWPLMDSFFPVVCNLLILWFILLLNILARSWKRKKDLRIVVDEKKVKKHDNWMQCVHLVRIIYWTIFFFFCYESY